MYKLFTDSDLDGISCGVLARLVFNNENVDISYCVPGNINDNLNKFIESGDYLLFEKVFITDLVIKEVTARKIDELKGQRFKLIDHHRSSYCNCKFSWVEARENFKGRKTCGAELFWKHLQDSYVDWDKANSDFQDNVDKYVEYVRLWDTWDFQYADNESAECAKKLHTLCNIVGYKQFANSMKYRVYTGHEYFTAIENNIIEIEDEKKRAYIKQKMKSARIVNYKGYNIGIVFAENYISELGNKIASTMDVDFAAIIIVDINVVSLRAVKKSNVDLSEIAKGFNVNGGGHPLAAGFVYEKDFNDELITKIFE